MNLNTNNNDSFNKEIATPILVTDLDGTLFFDHIMNDDDRSAIAKFRKSGGKIVVATGRIKAGINHIRNAGIDYDYLILGNGALILDKNHNELFRSSISKNRVNEIYDKFAHNKNVVFWFSFGEQHIFVGDKETAMGLGVSVGDEIININEFKQINKDALVCNMKILSESIEEAEVVVQETGKMFDDVIAYRNSCYVDFAMMGCSKGRALKDVMNIMVRNRELPNNEIVNHETHAIGDGWNDLSMFEVAKYSYTFHHAEKLLQSKAQYVVANVSECIDMILKK